MDLHLAREEIAATLELDPAVDDLADRVARRRERAPDVQHVVAQVGDPAADLRRRPLLDLVLELVDLVVQIVDQVEVALRNVVDQPEGEHADVFLGRARLLDGLRVVRRFVRRRLRHGHEPVGREDEVHLLVIDAVLRLDRDDDEQDAEHVVPVRLDPRARLVVVDMRREQQIECSGVDVPR